MLLHLFSDANYNLLGFNATYIFSLCPGDCGGHGRCDAGSSRCQCHQGWGGADCSLPVCSADCTQHGNGHCDKVFFVCLFVSFFADLCYKQWYIYFQFPVLIFKLQQIKMEYCYRCAIERSSRWVFIYYVNFPKIALRFHGVIWTWSSQAANITFIIFQSVRLYVRDVEWNRKKTSFSISLFDDNVTEFSLVVLSGGRALLMQSWLCGTELSAGTAWWQWCGTVVGGEHQGREVLSTDCISWGLPVLHQNLLHVRR